MDNNGEYKFFSKLSNEGLSDWDGIRSQLERHAMKKQKTQAFGLEIDLLLKRFPCEEDFPEEATLKRKKQYFEDRGITTESQFQVQNMTLWAILADVVVDCPWATAICDQHRGEYVTALIACDHHVVSRENDHRTMDRREAIAKAFNDMTTPQEVVTNILIVKQNNAYIKKMGSSGVPYSDTELLIMLRQRMRSIGQDLNVMEMNSHLDALNINTWDTLTIFLSKAIQMK
jgi:hypothetical protein